jgi:hypothetical protein
MLAAVRWNENGWTTEDSLEELARLAESADLEVVGAVSQNLSRPNPTHYLGKGKVAEVKAAREDLNYDVLVVDEELSPSQLRNLEDALQVKVIDRTALIWTSSPAARRRTRGACRWNWRSCSTASTASRACGRTSLGRRWAASGCAAPVRRNWKLTAAARRSGLRN